MNCCSNILVYPVNHVVNHDGVCFIKIFTILRLRWGTCKFEGNIIWARNGDTIVWEYMTVYIYLLIFSVMRLINYILFLVTFKNADWCASGKTIVCMNPVILVVQPPLAGHFTLCSCWIHGNYQKPDVHWTSEVSWGDSFTTCDTANYGPGPSHQANKWTTAWLHHQ